MIALKLSTACQYWQGIFYETTSRQSMSTVPTQYYQQYLGHDADVTLLKCRSCKSIPERCGSVVIGGCHRFISVNCASSACGTWFFCCVCYTSFRRWHGAEKHAGTKKHKQKLEESQSETPASVVEPSPLLSAPEHQAALGNSQPLEAPQNSLPGDDLGAISGENQEEQENTPEEMDVEVNSISATPVVSKVDDSQHDWLSKHFQDQPIATQEEVSNSLSCSPNLQ